MSSLRIVLFFIGILAILALLGHGLWAIRKNNQNAKGKRESLERKRRRPPEDLFSASDDVEVNDNLPEPIRPKPARGSRHTAKREPAFSEDVDTSLLADTDVTEPDLEQIEINLDEDNFAARQGGFAEESLEPRSAQLGLLDDSEEIRVMSAQEESIHAADSMESGIRGDGNILNEADDLTYGSAEQIATRNEPDESNYSDEITAEAKPTPDFEVITLYVTGDIQGAILLQMTTELGLKYGEMDIFHRHIEPSGHGSVLFSLANMFNPGTFDIHSMEQFHSEGIVLFMQLPLKVDGHQSFTMMYNAANKIADAMPRAAVLDGNRNPVTKQSVQHTYQRIREFERQQRLHKSTTPR